MYIWYFFGGNCQWHLRLSLYFVSIITITLLVHLLRLLAWIVRLVCPTPNVTKRVTTSIATWACSSRLDPFVFASRQIPVIYCKHELALSTSVLWGMDNVTHVVGNMLTCFFSYLNLCACMSTSCAWSLIIILSLYAYKYSWSLSIGRRLPWFAASRTVSSKL